MKNLDQTEFVLSEEQWAQLEQALEAPLPDAVLLLLTRPSPWQ